MKTLLIPLSTWALMMVGADTQKLNTSCSVEDRLGTCIPIRDCKELFAILQERAERLTQAQIDFLRKFHCGFQSTHPLVCCLSHPPPSLSDVIPQDVSNHPNLGLINNSCGRAPLSTRIINGDKSDIFEFPWMARLIVKSWRGERFTCGGTVINERYILTAAHCVPKNNQSQLVSTSLGYHTLSEEERCEGEGEERVCIPLPQNIPVEQVIVHPQYNKDGSFSHDIALVRLSASANLQTDSVKPICLPVEYSKQSQDLEGLWLTVAGWGQTLNETESQHLLQVAVPVVNTQKCQELWHQYGTNVSSSQLCAGDSTLIRGSCKGDSGGPFMTVGRINSELRMIQYGIISYGPGACTNTKVPVVYTRIGHYIRWILNTLTP